MQAEFDRILDDAVHEVVIDFREVPFIDSSGIGEILRVFRLVRERQGEVELVNPNKKLRDLFTMYRFEKFMKIREEVEAGKE